MNDIFVKNLSKAYKRYGEDLLVLNKLNFTVSKHEFVSVVGNSGCGKTTLLKIIGGLLCSTYGEILINKDVPFVALKRHRMGFIFQESVLLPWRTSIENVKLAVELTHLPISNNEVMEVMKLIGLAKYLDFYPAELSGGMKARVSMCATFIIKPSILLMDEPFAQLDEITRQNMNEILLNQLLMTGATAVLVTHNISDAVFLSDRIIVLSSCLPSTVKTIVDIKFPRPRDRMLRFENKFVEKVKEIQSILSVQNEENKTINS